EREVEHGQERAGRECDQPDQPGRDEGVAVERFAPGQTAGPGADGLRRGYRDRPTRARVGHVPDPLRLACSVGWSGHLRPRSPRSSRSHSTALTAGYASLRLTPVIPTELSLRLPLVIPTVASLRAERRDLVCGTTGRDPSTSLVPRSARDDI